MYKYIATLILLVLLGVGVCSAQRYQRVCIESPTSQQIALVASLDDDHARSMKAGGLETVLAESAVERLRTAGCSVTVLIADLEGYYRDRAQADLARIRRESPRLLGKPSASSANFALGSVGGFLSIDEYQKQLALMLDKYPKLVGAPVTIGKTIQGRPIYAVRISARPESDKTVTEVLLTGMHHAREPGSMMSLIYTMWRLLEGYGTDPEATYLLDNRAIYFIPLVNPDGYARNVTLNPGGGGMWRKNMRDDGNDGVDINRNYGPQDYWNNPAGGSSEDPLSDSYRGTAPFSEPETQALRDFCLSRRFSLVLNRHTYSNLLIYPFDWKTRTPNDSTYYRIVSRELAVTSGFAPGTAAEAVGYLVRGDADEWMYNYGRPGVTTIVWTPESGSDYDGFWPEPSRITPMAESDHAMNMLALWAAVSTPQITSVRRADDVSGKPVLRVTVTNLGRRAMDAQAGVKIDATGATETRLPALGPAQSVTVDLPIPESVAGAKEARPAVRILTLYHNVPMARTVQLPVHPLGVLFGDDFDGALSKWTLGRWGGENVTGRGRALSDSPDANYVETPKPNVAQTTQPISLRVRNADAAELTFDASYVVQARDHYVAVEIRKSGSDAWDAVECGQFQVPVDTTGPSRNRLRGNLSGWARYAVNLDKYLGSDIYLRFRFEAAGSQYGFTFNGILIDSLKIMTSSAPMTDVSPETAAAGSLRIAASPNPFADQLSVQLDGAGDRAEILLTDVLGRTVHRAAGSRAVFATGDLPGGYYTLSATDGRRMDRTPVLLRR